MPTISVTYRAAEGENDVVTTRGVKFFNGQAQELEFDDHKELILKSVGNPHFEVVGDIPEDKPKRGPGRPKKGDDVQDAG